MVRGHARPPAHRKSVPAYLALPAKVGKPSRLTFRLREASPRDGQARHPTSANRKSVPAYFALPAKVGKPSRLTFRLREASPRVGQARHPTSENKIGPSVLCSSSESR